MRPMPFYSLLVNVYPLEVGDCPLFGCKKVGFHHHHFFTDFTLLLPKDVTEGAKVKVEVKIEAVRK